MPIKQRRKAVQELPKRSRVTAVIDRRTAEALRLAAVALGHTVSSYLRLRLVREFGQDQPTPEA